MRPRALLPVALLLAALLLAGCSGLSATDGGSDPVEETVTPAPLPEDDRQLAPGVTSDGIVNDTALLGAHRETLDGRSYNGTVQVVMRHENGSVLVTFGQYVRADGDGRVRLLVRFGSGPMYSGYTDRVATWSTDSRDVVRREYRNGTVEHRVTDRARSDALVGPLERGLLTRYDPRPTGERAANGATEYLLTADDVTGVSFDAYRNVSRTGPGRLRAVVTESGFVRRVRVTIPLRIGEANGTYTASIRYDLAADPPERPDWVSRAIDRSSGSEQSSDGEPSSENEQSSGSDTPTGSQRLDAR